ncbi:MAG: hypothetical protein WC870_00280 [Candidatus Paceibacterota bacterium]
MTKHFFKTLTLFAFMIILGLVGVFVVNYFDKGETITIDANDNTEVAE